MGMNATDLKDVLKVAYKHNHSILIKSEPGMGKTWITREVALQEGYDFILMHPSVSEPTDIKGFPWCMSVNGSIKAEFVTYGEMERLLVASKPTVVCWDDLGHASEGMQAAIMQPLWARSLNGKNISPEVRFVGCTNDITHKAGVHGLIEPLKSRWHSIVDYKPSAENWCDWAIRNGQPHQLITFIRTKPTALTDFEPTRELTNSACPRTVANFGELIAAGYPDALLFQLGTGACGKQLVTDYIAWSKVYNKIPDAEAVLKDPKRIKIPGADEPGLLYALCGSVVPKVTKQNIVDALSFCERLPKEFSVMFMKDLMANDAATGISSHPEITKWCVANHVLFAIK